VIKYKEWGNSVVSSVFRRQQASALAILTCLAALPASAQDQSISDTRTAPVNSTAEIGNGSGTLTLTADGSIDVSSGTALTINGPHNFTMEATSTINSADLASGRGLLLDASTQQLISNIELAGDITVADPGDGELDFDLSTSVAGLELGGDFGLDGDILVAGDSTINVSGGDSRGIFINGPLTGDLTNSGVINVTGNRAIALDINGPVTGNILIDGSIGAFGADGAGVRIAETLDGSFTNRGGIRVGLSNTADNPAAPAVAGILVEANVTGGILLDGIGANNDLDLDGDGNDDITADSSVISVGGAPGVLIRGAEGSTNPLVIGEVGDLGFGYIQRGNIVVTGDSAGLTATGIRIEGLSLAAPTTIAGGLYFDEGNTSARSIDADAVGIDIGNFAQVGTLVNSGTVDVDSFSSSTVDDGGDTDATNDVTIIGPGGEAVAIAVRQQGDLSSIDNSGNLLATSRGDGQSAYAILDFSGGLNNITNSGVIGAIVEDTEGASANAIDVGVNTTGVSISNTGQIVGNIRLGSGDDTVTLSGGTVQGDIFFSSGADTLTLSGEASFNGSINFDGTLGLNVDGADLELGRNDTLHVTNATFTNSSNLIFNVNPDSTQAGAILIDNALFATADVNLVPVFANFVVDAQSYDLITAGSIDFADSQSSLALSDTPYLFDLSLAVFENDTSSTVTLNVRPKTAAELGVSASLTKIYDNMISTNVALDSQLETSLASLTSKETVEGALTALLPDITNASFNIATSSERQFAGHLANRLTDFVADANFEGGAWVREVTNVGKLAASESLLDGNLLSVGLTLGYDRPISKNIVVGMNGGFTLNGLSGTDDLIQPEFSSFAPFLSVYTLGRAGGFYAGLQATGQYVSIERERSIEFGLIKRLVTSTSNGWNLAATAEAGYELKLGGLHLKPYGRISIQNYSEGGYTEDGGESADLIVGGRGFTRTQATFGASLGYDFKWKRSRETKIFRPEIFYSYSKTINGADPEALDAIFVAGDTKFALEIDQLSERVEQYGGAFNLFGDGSNARVRYAYEKLDDLTAHAISVNFALTF